MANAAVNIALHCLFESLSLILCGIYPGMELQDHFMFNVLRNGSYTVLHSYQQCKRILISLHPCQYLLFSGFAFGFVCLFLIVAILTGVRWYFMVLVGTSLMISDVEHLFVCLLAICISSLGKCVFKSKCAGSRVFTSLLLSLMCKTPCISFFQ